MLRKAMAVALFSVMTGLIAWNCSDDSDGGTGPGGITPSGVLEARFSYVQDGPTMIITWPDTVYTWRYCDGDNLITGRDTVDGYIDTIPFELEGNTLSSMYDTQELSSGAVVTWWRSYARIGSGSGLAGNWRLTGISYTVISGTPTADEIAELDEEVADEAAWIASGWREELVITETTVSVYVSGPYADFLIEAFEDEIDTSMFDITISKVNNTTARLTGNISGEVVTITYNPTAETVTWTSSFAARQTHVYYNDPTSCPNDFEPDWIYVFFVSNLKTTLRKAPAHITLTPPSFPKSFARALLGR